MISRIAADSATTTENQNSTVRVAEPRSDSDGWNEHGRQSAPYSLVHDDSACSEQKRRCSSCGPPVGSWDIDKLTGVLNRWGWDERAPSTLGHSLNHREPAALLFVDLDSFKRVNDSYGHLGGDAVLRSVAAVLREVTSGNDLVGRFGGDEFVLLLPSTGFDRAMTVARRIRGRLRAATAPGGVADGVPGCSASIGIALSSSGRAAGIDLGGLLSDADSALHAAKRHGSDRTCLVHSWLGRDFDRPDESQLLFDPPLRDAPDDTRTTA